MNKIFFLIEVFLFEAKKRKFVLKSAFFGFLYLLSALIFFEFKSYQNIITQTYGINTKLIVILQLLIDSLKTLGFLDTLLITIISLLFGFNIELVLRKLKFLKKSGNLHITIGAGIISLFSAGCAACGLSFASVIGIAGVVVLLPLKGAEFYILAILILLTSLFYNLHVLVKVCKIKKIQT